MIGAGAAASARRGWQRFRADWTGVLGIALFVAILVAAVFAPWLAPHGLDWQAPDTGEITVDDGDISSTGLTHPAGPALGDLTGHDYVAPLGTTADRHGVLTQLLYGSRVALYVGVMAGLLSTLVGVPLGLISGYYGDTWIDESIQRLVDVLYGLPFLPLVIVLVAVNGATTTNVILAIALKSWTNNALVIRGETLSLSERTFVDAARAAVNDDSVGVEGTTTLASREWERIFYDAAETTVYAYRLRAGSTVVAALPSNVPWERRRDPAADLTGTWLAGD